MIPLNLHDPIELGEIIQLHLRSIYYLYRKLSVS